MSKRILGAFKRLFFWVWGDELRGLRQAVANAKGEAQLAVDEVKGLRKQLSAVMAIDVDLHDGGKVVLLSRVNGQDRCKIIGIERDLTAEQYRDFVQSVEKTYGARARWADTPQGWPNAYVLTGEGR